MAEIRCVTAGEGRFALEAVAVLMPRGITVTAFTPGYAHLGATAQAIPRPEHDRTATVSILAVPCHRDESLFTISRQPLPRSSGCPLRQAAASM